MTEAAEVTVTQEDVRRRFVRVHEKLKALRRTIKMTNAVVSATLADYGKDGADYPTLYAALGEVEELLP